jgi:hypothetical protein
MVSGEIHIAVKDHQVKKIIQNGNKSSSRDPDIEPWSWAELSLIDTAAGPLLAWAWCRHAPRNCSSPQRPTRHGSLLPHAYAGRRRNDQSAGEMRGRVDRGRRRVELPETPKGRHYADDPAVRLGFGRRDWSPLWARAHPHPRLRKISGPSAKKELQSCPSSVGWNWTR